MYELKLLNNWEQKAQEKVTTTINGKRKTIPLLSKQQIKEIDKIVAQSKVKKSTDEYTIYQLK